ncbi:ribonuclease HIII [Bacillus sp. FJAT-49736]|uniref:ribonuclease HIII n=1 Tax=Bacillus sp. FJAT-49736 TaxID=2833582 RepID=UPI001BC9ED9B|nr:ribonuclease HIII [Bacillus sp. FJAT-49736]MBS4173763.1 ribonuclease HIII [Bacillus sp. FJAT-49736]
MSNIIIQAPPSLLENMKAHYKGVLIDKIPQGGVFVAKMNNCTITAYKSGKVMFQGKNNEIEAGKWGNPEAKKPSTAAKAKTSGPPLPKSIGTMSLIGSDEVGTGDYFGPITVVSTYVKTEQIPLLKELGVKDSKDLSDPQILKIAKDLLHVIPYSSLKLPNEKYNQLQSTGMTQGKMKAILHNQALIHLLNKISPEEPEGILIDQFVEANTYFRHLKDQKQICRKNVYFSTKGESVHIAVAAASILARYAFVKAMDELSVEAGFTLPKGAGHQVDQAAAKLIKLNGEKSLDHFTKLHFANTEKAKKITKGRS